MIRNLLLMASEIPTAGNVEKVTAETPVFLYLLKFMSFSCGGSAGILLIIMIIMKIKSKKEDKWMIVAFAILAATSLALIIYIKVNYYSFDLPMSA